MKHRFLKLQKKHLMLIAALAVILLIIGLVAVALTLSRAASGKGAETAMVIRGTIENTVHESGLVVFDEDYALTPLVSARVTACFFNEGDAVRKGQILYELDSSDLSRQIQQAQISLDKARTALSQCKKAEEDLRVRSHVAGMVTALYCHEGDYVSAGGKIADVVDSRNLLLKIPFLVSDKESLYPGAQAEVTMRDSGFTLYGTVSKLYDSPQAFDGGKEGIMVEISLHNPGAVKAGERAYARVGSAISLSDGEFLHLAERGIYATQSGQVKQLYIAEGASVSDGLPVMVIKNDSLTNATENAVLQVREAETNLAQLQDKQKDYNIFSPIDGIVTQKNAKPEDIVSPSAPMAVVSDAGQLYVDVDVDELYINQIGPGQSAEITTQDASGAVYTGTVQRIDDKGQEKNGVTYYTVRISLDQPAGLREAMNVDVTIFAGKKENVLLIPVSALKNDTVKLLRDGGTVETRVVTGSKHDEMVEIVSGLSEGEQVVIGGASK